MKILPRILALLGGVALLAAVGLLAYHLLGPGKKAGRNFQGYLGSDKANASAVRKPPSKKTTGPGATRPKTSATPRSAQPQAANQPESTVPVRITQVIRGPVRDEIRQNTTLASTQVGAVFSPLSGIVRTVAVKEGDRVRAGQLLVQLDDQELKLKLATAQVSVARDNAEWKRQSEMRNEALEDRKEYREARHNFDTRKVALEQKRNDRRRKDAEAKRLVLAFREQLASEKERDEARYGAEQARLEVADAHIQLKRAEDEWNRMKALDARKLNDETAYTQARFAYLASKAEMELAALKVRQARITAPMTGVVTERKVESGDYIANNTRLITLVDLAHLEAELRLPESQWFQVKRGQRIMVFPEALPGKQFVGRVSRVNPTIDPENGTFKITLAISDTGRGLLRPGMFVVVRIRTAVRNRALLIPRQAVLGDEDRRFVYVVENGKAQRRGVVLGTTIGENVEVQSGLKEDQRVVVAGQHRLRPGRIVKVLE